MSTKKDNKLIVTIIVATVIISASLIYLASRIGGPQKSFEEQLKEYQAQLEKEQLEAEKKAEQEAIEKAKKVAPISSEDHVYGNKDAEITIYEYSDFECPFCKRFYKTPKIVVDESKGKVNLVFRHFPLEFHGENAVYEALAAECAGEQGKFWEMHDLIFENTASNGKGVPNGIEGLVKLADQLKLDRNAFRQCVEKKKYQDKVDKDLESGIKAGVRGTPGNIVKNNKTGEVKVIPGAYPIEAVREVVSSLE